MMARGKRDRQTRELQRAGRELFGIRAKTVTATPTNMRPDPRVTEREEQRLAASVDEDKAGPCRLCGITVEPGSVIIAGWRACQPCANILPDGLAGLLSDLLGEMITPTEADEVARRTRLGNPAFFLTGWPNATGASSRWAHVDTTEAIAALPAVLADIRGRGTLRTNTLATGCGWCGTARSTKWTESPFRYGRNGPRAALCAACSPWAGRAGVHNGSTDPSSWRSHLLAACVGMKRPQWNYALGLVAYFESNPSDPSGTAEPWAYLGGTRSKLRLAVAAEYPRLVTLSPKERRVLTLQRAAAQRPPVTTPSLADV
jgi:hypothetical protein